MFFISFFSDSSENTSEYSNNWDYNHGSKFYTELIMEKNNKNYCKNYGLQCNITIFDYKQLYRHKGNNLGKYCNITSSSKMKFNLLLPYRIFIITLTIIYRQLNFI